MKKLIIKTVVSLLCFSQLHDVSAAQAPALIDHIPVGATVQAVTGELIKRMSENRATPGYVKMCLEYGVNSDATLNSTSVTLLMCAAQKVNVGVAQKLIEYGAQVNRVDALGSSALLHLPGTVFGPCGVQVCAFINLLCEAGADINATNVFGVTLLHKLVSSSSVVKHLLEKKIQFDVQDQSGATPLMNAVNDIQPKTVALLLNAGADPLIQNNQNQTALNLTYQLGGSFLPMSRLQGEVLEEIQRLLVKACQRYSSRSGKVK